MASERRDIFSSDEDMDLSVFTPKADDQPSRPSQEALAALGQGKFVSREPKPIAPAEPPKAAAPTRPPGGWRIRTGRDRQFNVRASQATIDGFNAMADRMQSPVAVVIERALQALEREMEATSESGPVP